jgi:hypothetical protein
VAAQIARHIGASDDLEGDKVSRALVGRQDRTVPGIPYRHDSDGPSCDGRSFVRGSGDGSVSADLDFAASVDKGGNDLGLGIDELRKAPDDISPARAAAILAQINLGDDWKIELLDGTSEDLAAVFEDGARQALPLVGYFDGTETTNEARTNVGLSPIDGADVVPAIVSQPHERAIAWANDHAADLITGIEDRTRDMLRGTVVDALEHGWSARELADNIEESAGFSSYRAETISRYELITGHGQGTLTALKDSDVCWGKEWLLGDDPCEICQQNAEASPIPIDEDFPSGDDAPAAHPRCECALGPVIDAPEGDNEA